MIVRELVAKLGIVSDKRSFDKADQKINKTKDFLRSIAGYVTVGLVAVGFKKFIDYASDANETLNVLNESFGENSKRVQDWAQEFGESSARSQYAMREMAGQLGSVLNPLMLGNVDAASQMSTTLAALAVDLGSFFNTTDEDALIALRSGLTGQTEPLLKYGVVMLQANLEEYRRAQGIKKSIKEMSNSEKTQLRYNYILSQTKNAQGDAARTSQGYANATKGLWGSLRDLATGIGLKVLPTVEKIINFTRKGVAAFTKWTQQSKIVEVALTTLAIVAAAAGLKVFIAWLPVIAPILAVSAAIAALILIGEDFLTFLDGGDSLIGRFIDSLMGPGSAAEAAKTLREGFKALATFFKRDFMEAIQGIRDFVGFLVADFQAAKDKIASVFEWLNTKIKDITGIDIKAAISWIGGSLNDLIAEQTGYDFAYANKRIKERKEAPAKERARQIQAEHDRTFRGDFSVEELLDMKAEAKRIKKEEKEERRKKKNDARLKKAEARKNKRNAEKERRIAKRKLKEAQAYAKSQDYMIPKVYNPGGITKAPVTINQKTEVNIKGNVARKDAENLAERISQKTGSINKRALNALAQVSN